MKIYKKAVVTIYSYVLYVVISLSLIILAYVSASNFINDQQEEQNMYTMIESIQQMDTEIKDISKNIESRSQIIVFCPNTIEINCEHDFIKGEIIYSKYFREDGVNIQDISISKEHSLLSFLKTYNKTNIDLVCEKDSVDVNSLYLNKGNNTVNVIYKEYNSQEKKVLININVETIEHEIT
jgi:hypothetical protein